MSTCASETRGRFWLRVGFGSFLDVIVEKKGGRREDMVEYLYVFLSSKCTDDIVLYGLLYFSVVWISCGRAYARVSIAAQKTHDDSLLICVH